MAGRTRRRRSSPGREHRFSQRHLPSVLDDVLDDPTLRRVLAHVGECTDCQHDVDTWRRVTLAVHRLGLATDPVVLRRLGRHLDTVAVEDGARRP